LDSSVNWTVVLRAINLKEEFVPVAAHARFRYPRFVGRIGPLAIRAVLHETGREGYLWLDRERHILFGDLLREAIEWEDAGRRLHLRWHADAIVARLGDVDVEVRAEEARLVDIAALHMLRRELGESYRQSLAEILRTRGPLPFRRVYEELADRVGHRPNRDSIRAVLSVSPEFLVRGHAWEWRSSPSADRAFRRATVLAQLGLDPNEPGVDLARLADAARKHAQRS
jgi:hypothetical protein